MADYEYITISGAQSPQLKDVGHLLVPGRGRADEGNRLSDAALARVKYATAVYMRLHLANKGGVIVVSGYKSPGDHLGRADEFMLGYIGTPEADLMAQELFKNGIPKSVIRVERDSIDTATNLAFVEAGGYLQDNSPVAIIAQEGHLQRIVRYIAPKLLRRPFIGIVVPETPEVRDQERFFASVATWAMLIGIKPTTRRAQDIVYSRAVRLWRILSLFHIGNNYHVQD